MASAVAAGMLVAGCARTLHNTDAAVRDQGLGDRCADFMQRAFPGANIKITNEQAAPDPGSGTFATMVARVDGVRPKVSEEQAVARREVAVACRFENGILTSFRWIQGPLQ